MKSFGLGILCIAAAAAAAPAIAQRTGFDASAEATDVELPPRYRVEFILFAHNRFDPAEEHFDVVPPMSQFAATDEPIPQVVFDDDSRNALLELIDGPIVPPPLEADAAVPGDGELPGEEPELEAYLNPALIDGPATRYLEADELTLLPSLQRLERLDAYRPLVHGGWEQNGLAEADAVPIDLADFSITNPRGTIRLHVSRYLHITLDIAYRDVPFSGTENRPGQTPTFGDTTNPPQRRFGFDNDSTLRNAATPRYFLFEQRRILRGELNYFDHPAFGLLLKITLAPEITSGSDGETDGPSA